MTDFDVFNVIDEYRRTYCGFRPRNTVDKRWRLEKKRNSIPFKVCSQLSTLAQTKEDIEFIVGLSHVKFGDPWENMAKFLEEKTPKTLRKELYSRTDMDNKSVEKFLDTAEMSLCEFFRTPPGGMSVAYTMLRNLLINPWCYVNHLNVVDGLKLTKDEVKTLCIVKELTHAKKQH